MTIPDYQTIMLPLLQYISDGQEHSLRETINGLANQFQLTKEERKDLLPSGRQATFDNRVGWARTYMKKAGLVDSKKRGYFHITPRGLEVLKKNPSKIDNNFLNQFAEFRDFRDRSQNNKPEASSTSTNTLDSITPEEEIERAYQNVRKSLAIELIDTVKSCSPQFFEQLVVDLLVKMGYGGTRKDAGEAIGMSGDGGIDGIIKEDRLGLDIVYIQAKRWEGTVTRPEIQKFAGALQGLRARKGVFITTSSFSQGAEEYVKLIESKIVLIDGELLSQLMIDFNIGVSTISSYELKRIDSDYFVEE